MKESEIKLRVSQSMKADVQKLADASGESESYIVREALRDYLAGRSLHLKDAPSSTARDLVDAAAAAALQRAAAGKPAAAPVRYKLTRARNRKAPRNPAATSGNP